MRQPRFAVSGVSATTGSDNLTKPWLRSLVLVGEDDRQMMSIGVQLQPKAKWQELKELAARKTGLKPEPTERLAP